MSDFFFMIKTFVMTLLIVLLLQVKVGDETVEQQTYSWMQQSIAVEYLREVAEGAIKALRTTIGGISDSLDTRFGHVFNKKEDLKNRLQFEFKRSDEYYQSQVNKLKAKEAAAEGVAKDAAAGSAEPQKTSNSTAESINHSK